jgi:hypothetical protein
MSRTTRQILPILLIATLALPGALRSQGQTAPPTKFVGLTLASYHLADEVFKEVYGGAGAIFGLTASWKFFGAKNLGLSAVFDLRRFGRTGASTISQVETRLKLTPASLGVEGSLERGIVILWMAAGYDLYFYREESELQNTSGSTGGFHIAGGLALQPLPSLPLRLKLILRWTKARTTENGIPVELGGPEYGLGVLYGFKLL